MQKESNIYLPKIIMENWINLREREREIWKKRSNGVAIKNLKYASARRIQCYYYTLLAIYAMNKYIYAVEMKIKSRKTPKKKKKKLLIKTHCLIYEYEWQKWRVTTIWSGKELKLLVI